VNRRVLAPIAVLLLSVVAGLGFAPAFGGQLTMSDFAPGRLVVAVLAAVLAPVALVAVGARLGWSPTTSSLAGLAALAAAIAAGARPGGQVISGPYRLLTSALPADPDGPGLAAVAAVTGLAALIAALAMSYSRAVVLAVLAPLGCLGLALALDASVGEPPAWYAVAVVAPVGLFVAAMRGRPFAGDPRGGVVHTMRRALPGVSTVVVIAVAAVLATVLAPSLPGVRARPADVRELVSPPLVPQTGTTPLQQFVALRDDKLRVRLSGTSSRPLDRLRIVTLGDFDGTLWTTTARYRRAGHVLGDAGAVAAPGSVDVRINVGESGPLPWLAQPGHPLSLDAPGLGVDEATGDLAVPTGGKYPTAYRVVGRPAPDSGDPALATDDPVRRSGPVEISGRPVPDDISNFAQRVLPGSAGYLRLTALARQLRAPGFFVDDRPAAPGGHGYFQISALLTGARGIHAGTSEQYASAFAVMARVIGYDARVVLGLRPKYSSAGEFTARGEDLYVWAEVHFAHAGWVTFDPTPTALASLSRKTPPPPSQQPSAQGTPTPTPSKGPSKARPSGPTGKQGTAADSATNSTVAAYGIALLGGLVLILAVPAGAKAERRRRRRNRPPARAVYGAWQETLDRIIESGIHVRGGMTGGEVTGVAPPIARPYVAELAGQLDRAGYAPEATDAATPRLAWANAAVVRTELRRGMHPLRRLLAWVDPRPLWRR